MSRPSLSWLCLSAAASILSFSGFSRIAESQNADAFAPLQAEYEKAQSGTLKKYCLSCHSSADPQGELDLERFHSVTDIRGDVVPWQRVVGIEVKGIIEGAD